MRDRALNSHLENPRILVGEQRRTLCPGVIRETSEESSVPGTLAPCAPAGRALAGSVFVCLSPALCFPLIFGAAGVGGRRLASACPHEASSLQLRGSSNFEFPYYTHKKRFLLNPMEAFHLLMTQTGK